MQICSRDESARAELEMPKRVPKLIRTESRKVSDSLPEDQVELQIQFQPTEAWMTASVFEHFWQQPTLEATGCCVFEKLSNCLNDQVDGEAIYKLLAIELGQHCVILPFDEALNGTEKFKGAQLYATISIGKDQDKLVLVRVEQLYQSDQIRIAVRNTDPVEIEYLRAFVKYIQQVLQPSEVPPHPRSDEHRSSTDLGDAPLLCMKEEPRFDPPYLRTRSNTSRYRSSVVIFEGYLQRREKVLCNSWRCFYCVLGSECVMSYYESREQFMIQVGLKGRHVLESFVDGCDIKHSFALSTQGHDVQHFVARSNMERKQWVRAIQMERKRMKATDTSPRVVFGSRAFDIEPMYSLLGELLEEKRHDFPSFFECVHPDIVVSSNYSPIVPFWGQYRRYDGLLLFFTNILDTISIDRFELADVVKVDDPQNEMVKHSVVVTGRESFSIKQLSNRKLTQLFVHKLSFDYKGRLIRWQINGDSVAMSVAFDSCANKAGVQLVLPGEAKPVREYVPPGIVYVQVLEGKDLVFPSKFSMTNGYYLRCCIDQGKGTDRTHDGLSREHEAAVLNKSTSDEKKDTMSHTSKARRFVNGFKWAAGIPTDYPYCAFTDSTGAITAVSKAMKGMHGKAAWQSNLRLEFPGSLPGSSYFLRVEVYGTRFMKNDKLVGVCKINLAPHLALLNAQPEARANGSMPRWFNLCDKYNDCREWWAPPTVYRGQIKIGIIFATSNLPVDSPTTASTSSPSSVVCAPDVGIETDVFREYFLTQGQSHSDKSISSSLPSLVRENNTIADENACPNGKNLPKASTETLTYSFRASKMVFKVPVKYQLIKIIGAGAYGEVIAASDTSTGATVAIKQIPNVMDNLAEAKRILREVRLLCQLRHPNVIRIWDMIKPSSFAEFKDIYMVTDLMETDLHHVIHSSQSLSDEHVAHFVSEILRGLKYLHSANVLHRDLKPSNLLVNSNCELKICDLGLARAVDFRNRTGNRVAEDLTDYVVTRWYRSPEILLEGTRYGTGADIWSAGCIFAELLGRKPLFPGSSTIKQLEKIFRVLGTPNRKFVDDIRNEAAKRWLLRQKSQPRIPLKELYPAANDLALDLLDKMLEMDPCYRITATEALRHPYLQSYCGTSDSVDADGLDSFKGILNIEFEDVSITNEMDMKKALYQDICHFHPEAAVLEH